VRRAANEILIRWCWCDFHDSVHCFITFLRFVHETEREFKFIWKCVESSAVFGARECLQSSLSRMPRIFRCRALAFYSVCQKFYRIQNEVDFHFFFAFHFAWRSSSSFILTRRTDRKGEPERVSRVQVWDCFVISNISGTTVYVCIMLSGVNRAVKSEHHVGFCVNFLFHRNMSYIPMDLVFAIRLTTGVKPKQQRDWFSWERTVSSNRF
jgi:hypothetical protein